MIKKASLWQGGYLSTYKDKVDKWLLEFGGGAEVRRVALIDIDINDPQWENNEINDEGMWFDPTKVLLIDNVEAWMANSIDEMVKLLNRLDTEFIIAFIQRSMTKPIKAIDTALTEPSHDYGIPSDVIGLSEWIIEWLDSRDVGIPKSAARRLAEHAGENVESVVQICQALALGHRGFEIVWGDILPQLGELGEVSIFDLTNAIIAGDREQAVTVARRIANISSPLQPLKLLSNKYRQYAATMGTQLLVDDLATKLNANKWVLRHSIREARKLGRDRVIRSYALIAEAERNMKGGSKLKPQEIFEILVIQLAQQFRLAS